ncbi:MAG: ferredoxin--NADP reductase [Sandaracinaceae bacterium]
MKRFERTRRRRVGRIDVAASALSRLAPRGLRGRIDRLRLDARAVVDGFRPEREPTYAAPGTPPWVPTPLGEIDPLEHALPRGRLRRSWVTLRTDLRWLARDLRGEGRPPLVTRAGPSRYASAASPLDARTLVVGSIERETAEAVTVRLRETDGAPLRFEAGQFLTLELDVEGARLRRAYSLSSSPLDGPSATITVKRIDGGRASSHIVERLQPGARLRARGPSGAFLAPRSDAHLVMIAGGSGITPIASIAETVLRARPATRVSLLYGNRGVDDVIFGSRLRALMGAHPERLRVTHVLERPPAEHRGPVGRVDASAVHAFLEALPEQDLERVYYVCGPSAMMDGVLGALAARGVPDEAIRVERFQSPQDPVDALADLPSDTVMAQIEVGGRAHLVPVAPGQTVLEAGLGAGAPMPFSCAMGGCAACKGKLVSGRVKMEEPSCLTAREREDGWVLTCCSRPLEGVRVELSSRKGE